MPLHNPQPPVPELPLPQLYERAQSEAASQLALYAQDNDPEAVQEVMNLITFHGDDPQALRRELGLLASRLPPKHFLRSILKKRKNVEELIRLLSTRDDATIDDTERGEAILRLLGQSGQEIAKQLMKLLDELEKKAPLDHAGVLAVRQEKKRLRIMKVTNAAGLLSTLLGVYGFVSYYGKRYGLDNPNVAASIASLTGTYVLLTMKQTKQGFARARAKAHGITSSVVKGVKGAIGEQVASLGKVPRVGESLEKAGQSRAGWAAIAGLILAGIAVDAATAYEMANGMLGEFYPQSKQQQLKKPAADFQAGVNTLRTRSGGLVNQVPASFSADVNRLHTMEVGGDGQGRAGAGPMAYAILATGADEAQAGPAIAWLTNFARSNPQWQPFLNEVLKYRREHNNGGLTKQGREVMGRWMAQTNQQIAAMDAFAKKLGNPGWTPMLALSTMAYFHEQNANNLAAELRNGTYSEAERKQILDEYQAVLGRLAKIANTINPSWSADLKLQVQTPKITIPPISIEKIPAMAYMDVISQIKQSGNPTAAALAFLGLLLLVGLVYYGDMTVAALSRSIQRYDEKRKSLKASGKLKEEWERDVVSSVGGNLSIMINAYADNLVGLVNQQAIRDELKIPADTPERDLASVIRARVLERFDAAVRRLFPDARLMSRWEMQQLGKAGKIKEYCFAIGNALFPSAAPKNMIDDNTARFATLIDEFRSLGSSSNFLADALSQSYPHLQLYAIPPKDRGDVTINDARNYGENAFPVIQELTAIRTEMARLQEAFRRAPYGLGNIAATAALMARRNAASAQAQAALRGAPSILAGNLQELSDFVFSGGFQEALIRMFRVGRENLEKEIDQFESWFQRVRPQTENPATEPPNQSERKAAARYATELGQLRNVLDGEGQANVETILRFWGAAVARGQSVPQADLPAFVDQFANDRMDQLRRAVRKVDVVTRYASLLDLNFQAQRAAVTVTASGGAPGNNNPAPPTSRTSLINPDNI